jgi:nitric oxide reductase
MHRKRGSEQALGYGYGPHQCVAEWLARAELEIVFGMTLLPYIYINSC